MENLSEHQITEKVLIIMRQTDYNEDKARDKLKIFNFNEIDVIKDYFGITEKKTQPVKSVNQAIYKHLRGHLDSAMRDYHERANKGEARKLY